MALKNQPRNSIFDTSVASFDLLLCSHTGSAPLKARAARADFLACRGDVPSPAARSPRVISFPILRVRDNPAAILDDRYLGIQLTTECFGHAQRVVCLPVVAGDADAAALPATQRNVVDLGVKATYLAGRHGSLLPGAGARCARSLAVRHRSPYYSLTSILLTQLFGVTR